MCVCVCVCVSVSVPVSVSVSVSVFNFKNCSVQDSLFFAETEETVILHRVLPEVLAQLREEGKMAEDSSYYPWSSK